jgi:Flp pilus assembly protein TadB
MGGLTSEPVRPSDLADLARALARGLGAGLPLPAACLRGADGLSPGAATALRRSGRLLAAGADPADAFGWTAGVAGGRVLLGAIAVHAELGGDLVATLSLAADALSERERLRGEVEVATAQARFAARVVPVIPLGALAMAAVLDPAALRPLAATTAGVALVGTAVILDLTGAALLRRMARSIEL